MTKALLFLRLCFAIFLVITSACSSSRRALPIDLPTMALETARQEASSDPLFEGTDWVSDEWWTLFDDEQLNDFILTAFERNPTLQAAKANILIAAANADKARSSLFPHFTWGGDIAREKLSKTGVVPFGNTDVPFAPGRGIPEYFTLFETQITLSYEFDIWGKNRNTLRAALSEVQANIADEAFRRLQLAISVASAYFQMQIDYKREQIGLALVENRRKNLNLTKMRMSKNLDSALTLFAAETSLAATEQVLLQIQADGVVNENRLKTYLAGDFEEEIFMTNVSERPLPKVPLPCELPLHLIAHRPDIISQLWIIQSAGRQIEVAKAGFYPDFNLLTTFFGFQTIHPRELFRWPSSYFSIDPAFSLPIFDGGRLLANLHGSEVNYDLAIFQYNELILNAVREVLDGIVLLRSAEAQRLEYKRISESQEGIFKLAEERVKHHIDSSLTSLTYEESVLVARDQEVVALGSTLLAILSLIKSLGGGYDACY